MKMKLLSKKLLGLYLHSNLVIFESVPVCAFAMRFLFIYIPIWLYSNHNELSQHDIAKLIFTFQSGDIQIDYSLSDEEQKKQIYIPIW